MASRCCAMLALGVAAAVAYDASGGGHVLSSRADGVAHRADASPQHRSHAHLYLVTVTYNRSLQMAYLRRAAKILHGLSDATWVICEDASTTNPEIQALMETTGLNVVHIAHGPTHSFGNAQRNHAYEHVRTLAAGGMPGVVYSMDDDNLWHRNLFDGLRRVRYVGAFAQRFVPTSENVHHWVERPVVDRGRVVGFNSPYVDLNASPDREAASNPRRFALDMGGFAFHTDAILDLESPLWNHTGFAGESEFLSRFVPSLADIEPLWPNSDNAFAVHDVLFPSDPRYLHDKGLPIYPSDKVRPLTLEGAKAQLPECVAVMTPAGRRERMFALERAMKLYHTEGVIDRWHLWDNTRRPADRDHLKRLAAKHKWIQVIDFPAAADSANKGFNKGVNAFWESDAVRDIAFGPCVVVRLDDDLVWLDEPKHFAALTAFARAQDEHLFTFFNVLNNAVSTYFNQQLGSFQQLPRFTDECMPRARAGSAVGLWRNCSVVAKLHDVVLRRGPAAYRHDHYYRLDNRYSINAMAWYGPRLRQQLQPLLSGSNLKVGCCCPSGKPECYLKSRQATYDDGVLIPHLDDEQWVSEDLARTLGLKNAWFGGAVVAHYGFSPQEQCLSNTTVLKRYAEMAEAEDALRSAEALLERAREGMVGDED